MGGSDKENQDWNAMGDNSDDDFDEETGKRKVPPVSAAEKGEQLVQACKLGHTDLVRALLLDGAPVNHEGLDNKWTPLLWAACRGHLECLAVLVENKAAELYIDTDDGNNSDMMGG